jgi:hypothetical protein
MPQWRADEEIYFSYLERKGTRKYNKNAGKTLQIFSSSLSILRIIRSRRIS